MQSQQIIKSKRIWRSLDHATFEIDVNACDDLAEPGSCDKDVNACDDQDLVVILQKRKGSKKNRSLHKTFLYILFASKENCSLVALQNRKQSEVCSVHFEKCLCEPCLEFILDAEPNEITASHETPRALQS